MLNITGRPWVLAFVRSWHPALAPPDELDGMRAQLRGLGAVLVIVSDAGAWSFRPDDDLERFADREAMRQQISAASARFGVEHGRDALFVIDSSDDVAFSYIADGALPTTLGEALAAAGTEMLAASRVPMLFSRREWAVASLCAGFALALFGCKGKPKEKPAPPPVPATPPAAEYDIVLDVNGTPRKLRVEARVSLLDALRERLGLTGTKKGCDHGQCGACTVHIDGRRVLACMTLAVMAEKKKIVTIEGLARGDTLHPVQTAFVQHDGFQCGYCTPGQIMSAVALIAEGHANNDAEIREWMSGNLCRCGAYPNIVAAIQTAKKGA